MQLNKSPLGLPPIQPPPIWLCRPSIQPTEAPTAIKSATASAQRVILAFGMPFKNVFILQTFLLLNISRDLREMSDPGLLAQIPDGSPPKVYRGKNDKKVREIFCGNSRGHPAL